MRLQTFFGVLAQQLALDLAKVGYFASSPNFRGGWEVWLQCEIGYAFLGYDATTTLTREVPYPSGQPGVYLTYNRQSRAVGTTYSLSAAARADFLIERPAPAIQDSTHLELKCHSSLQTLDDTWNRFDGDWVKIVALSRQNGTLNCIALLGTWGTFNAGNIQTFRNDANLRMARVLDFSGQRPLHTLLSQVAPNGANRFFLVGMPGSQTVAG